MHFFILKDHKKYVAFFNCKNTHLAIDYATILFYYHCLDDQKSWDRKYSLDIYHWVCGHHQPDLIILAVKITKYIKLQMMGLIWVKTFSKDFQRETKFPTCWKIADENHTLFASSEVSGETGHMYRLVLSLLCWSMQFKYQNIMWWGKRSFTQNWSFYCRLSDH